MALPILLLATADHDSLGKAFGDTRFLDSVVLIVCTITYAAFLGDLKTTLPEPYHFSWLLLIQVILTTAYVIWSAWRRGRRDAEDAVAGEDE